MLEADGVRVIVEGKTNIKKGITTTNFATTPDVPVSSITVNLPVGPALGADDEKLNDQPVHGEARDADDDHRPERQGQVKQNTMIAPTGCGVQIVGHKVVGNTAYLTVETYAAGRISGSGKGLSTQYAHARRRRAKRRR